jgi:hypothetical protein
MLHDAESVKAARCVALCICSSVSPVGPAFVWFVCSAVGSRTTLMMIAYTPPSYAWMSDVSDSTEIPVSADVVAFMRTIKSLEIFPWRAKFHWPFFLWGFYGLGWLTALSP